MSRAADYVIALRPTASSARGVNRVVSTSNTYVTTVKNSILSNTNSYIATKLTTTVHSSALANTNTYIATKSNTTDHNLDNLIALGIL